MFFSTVQVQNGCPLFLKEHLDKLKSMAKRLGFSLMLSTEQILPFIQKNSSLARKERLKIKVYGSNQWELELQHEKNDASRQDKRLSFYPSPFFEENAHLKKLDFSNRHKKLLEANHRGLDDWIFLDQNENILETCIANLFWIKNQTVYFPDQSLPYYQGVTMQFFLEILKSWGYLLKPTFANSENLKISESLFYCNSMKELCAVVELEGQKIKAKSDLKDQLLKVYDKKKFKVDALLPNL